MPSFLSHVLAKVDNAIDMGAAGANRFRHLYLAGSIRESTAIAARAIRTSTQTANNNTSTPLQWDYEILDTDGLFTPTTSRFYCQTDGIYLAGGGCSYGVGASGGGTRTTFSIQKNSGTYFGVHTIVNVASVPMYMSIVSGAIQMRVGDYIEIVLYQSTGAAVTISAATAANQHLNYGWIAKVA